MKTLGVTGGIGSGKSTVCRMLEELGASVFYADDVAKRLMEEDERVRDEIREAFGAESYRPDGALNRHYLAQTVFKDPVLVERINQIVHPRVFAAFEEERKRAERAGVPLLVEEAALIFESGADKHLDAVAVVDAPQEVRVRRVVERDGVTPEQVRARMAHQLPAEELRARADYVIVNEGSPELLRKEVEALYRSLVPVDG